jgi:hypothetical protein
LEILAKKALPNWYGLCQFSWPMKALWFRRGLFLVALYGIGLWEVFYVAPRYGIEWLLGALGVTAALAGIWMRAYWDN